LDYSKTGHKYRSLAVVSSTAVDFQTKKYRRWPLTVSVPHFSAKVFSAILV